MRLDQVEHRSGEPDQRKSPDAAGDSWFVALVDFLEGEAEKKREDEQQGQPFASSIGGIVLCIPRRIWRNFGACCAAFKRSQALSDAASFTSGLLGLTT